jgi:NAD(P)-dependent dehydrogenase (short-subunit alcohol dehydrogenase family)
MKLQNQKVIIMGGTSGMGLATAKAAATAGAAIVITGRDQNKLDNALAELPQGVIGEIVDATAETELRNFFGRSGSFDHLVLAVSGRKGGGPFESLGVDTLKLAFDGKFWAQFMAAQMGLTKLRKNGSIVFITAASARTSIPGTAGLAAINGALEAMIPTLALELKPIRVNAVSPGVVKTPWWDTLPSEQREAVFAQTAQSLPVGRIGTPEDVAEVIMLLLRNGFMTGTVIECDGGIRIK